MLVAHTNDSVLIEQVVYLASKARQATGQDPIFDIPKGTQKSNLCPIARALNLKCSVGASSITFPDRGQAEKVAEACGLTANGNLVRVPTGHPFSRFVARFDGRSSPAMIRLRLK